MRFKIDKQSGMLLATSFAIFTILIEDKLNIYIHPRYVVFTVVLSGIALAITMLGTLLVRPHDSHKNKKSIASLLPLVLIITFIFLLPPKTLTSSTVNQRISTNQTAQQETVTFTGSTKALSVSDWYQILSFNDDPDYYVLKPAKITGFIYDAGLGDDTVWVSRFILTCCAVDARPVGVPVRIENWRDNFSEDDWVDVEGSFYLQETDKGQQMILIPEKLELTTEPEVPYEV